MIHHFLLIGGEHAQGGDVGAYGHESGVPEGEHSGEAVDDVEGNGEDAVHGHEVQDLDFIAVEGGGQEGEAGVFGHAAVGPPEEEKEQGYGKNGKGVVAGSGGSFCCGHQIFSFCFSPNRPVGFTRRTTTSRTKAKASR